MNFQRISDPASHCFLGYPSVDLKTEQLEAVFGRAGDGAEPLKGYDNEFVFEDENGAEVVLYDRYGVYRIGGTDVSSAEEFCEWLGKQLGMDIKFTEWR